MKKIDFISAAPNLAIFKTGTNQTYLGASLFLIYLIVLLVLAVIYFYDYFSQSDFSFEYTFAKNATNILQNEGINELRFKNYDFKFDLTKDDGGGENYYKNLSSNFLIVDFKKLNKKISTNNCDGFTVINSNDTFSDECIIKPGEEVTMQIPILMVLYRCNGITCDIRKDDKIKFSSYHLHFYYRGYSIDHQNHEKPVQLLPKDNYSYIDYQFLENINIIIANWRVFQYEEKKGVFSSIYDKIMGKNSIFYGIDFTSSTTLTDDGHIKKLPTDFLKIKDQDGNHFIVLLSLENKISYYDYDKYTRKAKSFLDALTNIFALGSTVLHFFALALSVLFSTNFDNYKIIENILKKNYRININKSKEEKEKDNSSKIELKTDLIGNINDESEEQNINMGSDKNNGEDNEKNISSSQDIDLPELKFYDFLFHKLYFKCFGPSSKQALINSCNDIVATYITIEKLISNQIKLDYLWKDYKWNNPQSEINERDDLILKLKEK